MKKITFCLLLFVSAILLLSSCSKDFNSNAEMKDVTVVYGILNAGDNTHYIKIYRGFLTEGNAEEAALVYDSIYYKDEIEVTMEESLNGHLTNSWPLDTTTEIAVEPGDFASPKQLVYVFHRTLNPEAEYTLRIRNRETGRVVTATSNLVGSYMVASPSARLLNITNGTPNPFKVTTASNAYAFEVFQNFYYIERNKTTHEEVVKHLRRRVNPTAVTTNNFTYTPSVLLTAIASAVKPDPTVDRYISVDSCVQFEVWAVNEPLYQYVQSMSVSGSVVLDRLVYTNINAEDGLVRGIFGARSYATSWHGLNTQSQDELVRGSLTGNLGFHYAYEYLELHN